MKQNRITGWALSALVLSFFQACGSGETDSANDIQERVGGHGPDSWKNDRAVQQFLGEAKAVRVNARSNYATYYENGQPVARWKVATARTGHATPKGIFRIHTKSVCPPWNNGRGQSAGPCAPDNPLGRKALWFSESFIYGLHGVNTAALDSVTVEDPRQRDRSAGCVRNHPENIEWLFARVQVGTPVVVGLWDTDPAVTDCSGKADMCGAAQAPTPRLPQTLPTWCAINVSADGGLANVRSGAQTDAEIVQQLRRERKVNVLEKVSGESVNGSADWYFVKYTLGGPKEGFLHSSLLDCTR